MVTYFDEAWIDLFLLEFYSYQLVHLLTRNRISFTRVNIRVHICAHSSDIKNSKGLAVIGRDGDTRKKDISSKN